VNRVPLQWKIIDAIAPFILSDRLSAGETINWSKVPFGHLAAGGGIAPEVRRRISSQFDQYCRQAAAFGYNALSIDDLAHLIDFQCHPPPVKQLIGSYRKLFENLIGIAASHRCRVFINTDVLFRIPGREFPSGDFDEIVNVLHEAVFRVFLHFPSVAGIILRLGECDGQDVTDQLRSELVIKTPRQARQCIDGILPLFERYGKLLIVRTWTVGAYPIGDLLWNRRTFRRVFGGLTSANLIVSIKYGETDFYRYLRLNPLFFEGTLQKIIELQARREYEGFGAFPSYVGFDYARYRDELRRCPNLIGMQVWCQTGGWSRFQDATFVHQSSVWNELNAFAAIAVFVKGIGGRQAVADFSARRFPHADGAVLQEIVDCADQLMLRLWYLPEFSRRQIFFRRIRIPPLVWIFWDTIVINRTLKLMLRRLVHHRREAIADGYDQLEHFDRIGQLWKLLELPVDQLTLYRETFTLIALCREYFLGEWSEDLAGRLQASVARYHRLYPTGFTIELNLMNVRTGRAFVKALLRLLLRTRSRYRLVDLLLLIRFTGLLYPFARLMWGSRLPKFAKRQTMGLQALFR
jgi:hypothetical protein